MLRAATPPDNGQAVTQADPPQRHYVYPLLTCACHYYLRAMQAAAPAVRGGATRAYGARLLALVLPVRIRRLGWPGRGAALYTYYGYTNTYFGYTLYGYTYRPGAIRGGPG